MLGEGPVSIPVRIAALLLTLAIAGCSTHMIPGNDGLSGSGGAGATSTCGGGATGAAAYVYVSAGFPSNYHIVGFAAASDGTLSPVPGSPLATSGIFGLITTGTGCTLFGTDGYNIDSYLAQANGRLTSESSVVAGQGNPTNPSVLVTGLYLDTKGSSLYSYASETPDGTNPEFTSWSFDRATGQMAQVGAPAEPAGGMLVFAANNQFAVSPHCSAWVGSFLGEYERDSDGALTALNEVPLPTAAPEHAYCPTVAAADASDHILVGMGAEQGGYPSNNPGNSDQFAIYTVDDSGKLSTASTWQNMPNSYLGWLGGLQFSPDYRYLAAAGYTGLQVFAWNRSTTTLTSIATIRSGAYCWQNSSGSGCKGAGFGNLVWDENDHLYTILGQHLIVYSVSQSGVTPAAGSPHELEDPQWVSVLPLNAQ